MRTTISLDDDILRVAKELAHQQGRSLGAALSELARRGLTANRNFKYPDRDDIPVFSVRENSPTFSSEDVKRDEDGW